MTRTGIVHAVVLSLGVLAWAAPGRTEGPSANLSDYAIYGGRVTIREADVAGDVGATQRLTVSERLAVAGDLAAKFARLTEPSQCERLFSTDALPVPGCGPVIPGSAPEIDLEAACALPAACDATKPVHAPRKAETHLAPGVYGSLRVDGGGQSPARLVLEAGSYVFCDVIVGRGAAILAPEGTDVRVIDDVVIGGAVESSAGLGPFLTVGGRQVYLGRRAHFDGRICAPSALTRLSTDVEVDGCVASRRVSASRDVRVTCEASGSTTTTTTTSLPSTTTSTGQTSTTTSTTTTTTASTSTTATTTSSSTTSRPTSTSTTTTSTSTVTTTSTTTTTLCSPNHCGDGVVEAECNEVCDPAAPSQPCQVGSASGAFVCVQDCTQQVCEATTTSTTAVTTSTTTSTSTTTRPTTSTTTTSTSTTTTTTTTTSTTVTSTTTTSTSTTTTTASTTTSTTTTTTSTTTSTTTTTTSTTTTTTTTSTTTTTTSTTSTTVPSTTTTTTTAPTTSTTTTTTTVTTTGATTSTTQGPPVCGNGFVEGNEQCDDGNDNNTDDCLNNCHTATCGDGAVHGGVEACDDGNTNDADCCRNDCTPKPGGCGNGCITAGESCDDGNTLNGDGCPAGCVINPCAPTATKQLVTVTMTRTVPPAATSLGAISVLLDYPDGTVSLPGIGGDTTVRQRVSNTPTGRQVTVNDLDYALRTGTIANGTVFKVNFDVCSGAGTITAAMFTCTIESASTTGGIDYTSAQLAGVTCAVTVP